jgi:hypothetical protein
MKGNERKVDILADIAMQLARISNKVRLLSSKILAYGHLVR